MAITFQRSSFDYRTEPSIFAAQMVALNTFASTRKVIQRSIDDEFIVMVFDTDMGGTTASTFTHFDTNDKAGVDTLLATQVLRGMQLIEGNLIVETD